MLGHVCDNFRYLFLCVFPQTPNTWYYLVILPVIKWQNEKMGDF